MSVDDWTPSEEAQLRNALARGDSWEDIAAALLREKDEVIVHAAAMQRGLRQALADEEAAASLGRHVTHLKRTRHLQAVPTTPTGPATREQARRNGVTPRPLPACSASVAHRGSEHRCCLITRHRGDHLTDDGLIFNTVRRVWRDTGDLYLMVCFNNDLVAAKRA